jgi:hypothetical protein
MSEEYLDLRERKWQETGQELHNDELRDVVYSSPNIRVMKSGSIRRADHVARMGERGNSYKIFV